MSLHGQHITPHRLAELAKHMTVEQIAQQFDVSEQMVENVLSHRGISVRAPFLAKCNRTGKMIRAYSERSAYLKAQIAGFADWDIIDNPTHEQTLQAIQGERKRVTLAPALSKRQDGLGARS